MTFPVQFSIKVNLADLFECHCSFIWLMSLLILHVFLECVQKLVLVQRGNFVHTRHMVWVFPQSTRELYYVITNANEFVNFMNNMMTSVNMFGCHNKWCTTFWLNSCAVWVSRFKIIVKNKLKKEIEETLI